MEILHIHRKPHEYDQLVHNSCAQVGNEMDLAYKPDAMKSGRGAVVISFLARVKGQQVRVQGVTSAANLVQAAKAIEIWEAQAGN